MKQIKLTIVLLAAYLCAGAQELAVDNISPTLRAHGNAVIRYTETTVDMLAPDNVLLSVKVAITVFNKNGDRYGRLPLFYDKNTSIRNAKGEIYDEFGRAIQKFSLSDFKDESAVNDFSLYEDSRVKYFIPVIHHYPYTIVYQYQVRNRQNLIIPHWRPIPGFEVALEKASYKFICKPDQELRIHALNYNHQPEEKETVKQKTLEWTLTNVPAIRYEPYSPDRDTFLPSIRIAPKNFVYYNFKGSYSNWAELGKLTYDHLLKGRTDLPLATQLQIKELVKDDTNDIDKIRKIYKFMQEKTRYISVQIGIGGFQPIKAAEVDRLGYGDCKGLVNYMQALLEVVNIESYYCVVEAGYEKKDLLPDFASMEQGNHVILAVPLKTDTVWLECTNQEIPFGFLGRFTEDRTVLACTKDGGKILRTPKYSAETSLQQREAIFKLSKEGHIEGRITTLFEGGQYNNHAQLASKSVAEREKMLRYKYDINNISFKEIDFSIEETLPRFTEQLKISIPNYATANSGKLFFNVNMLNIKRNVPSSRNRQLPLYIQNGFTDIDSLAYQLDDEIVPLLLPKKISIDNKFGNYLMETKIEGNTLVYYRKLMLKEGTYEAAEYDNYKEFIDKVIETDRMKLILSLKE